MTAKLDLPIDVVPGSNPPKFRWKQTVESFVGARTQSCEGTMPPSIEVALLRLIALAKTMHARLYGDDGMMAVVAAQAKRHEQEIAAINQELERLQKQIEGHVARIAAQGEIIAKQAEKSAPATSQEVSPKAGKATFSGKLHKS